MVKITATSDLHGFLPPVPECDILLIAGDICPRYNHDVDFQDLWLRTNFRTWLGEVPAKNIVFVAGNHDFYFEQCHKNMFEHMPHPMDGFQTGGKNVYYLQDRLVEILGLKIYGSPWQRRFYDWAFNLDTPELDKVFDKIPKCDILVTHSPAFGCGDEADCVPDGENWRPGVVYPKENTGSQMINNKCLQHGIKLHVSGHIHRGFGQYKIGNTLSCNVSLVNEKYQPVNHIMEFSI